MSERAHMQVKQDQTFIAFDSSICKSLGQGYDTVQVPILCGRKHWSSAPWIHHVDAGACSHQMAHYVGMAASCRTVQGGQLTSEKLKIQSNLSVTITQGTEQKSL